MKKLIVKKIYRRVHLDLGYFDDDGKEEYEQKGDDEWKG